MFNPFKLDNKNEIVLSLLNIEETSELFTRLTALQNEININHDTKIVAVTSINSDYLTAAFAKALADTYALNRSSALIIDANLYNPCLYGLTKQYIGVESSDSSLSGIVKINRLNEKVTTICIDKQVYPTDTFKSGVIHNLIKEYSGPFDHVILLVPALKEHKEVVLFKDVINSVLLVTQRNVTKKKDIYESLQFLATNNIPVAKTIVLK